MQLKLRAPASHAKTTANFVENLQNALPSDGGGPGTSKWGVESKHEP